jgi:hypothetical protein
MKKSKITTYLFLFLFLGTILISCKKMDSIKTDIPVAKELNDYKFLNQRLKEFAVAFAPALNNKEARNIIREKAKLKLDEEYEVLIRDLFKDNKITSLVPINVSQKLHYDFYKRSGEVLYPQIYIPRFQYIEDYPGSNKISDTCEECEEELVYVFYSGDAEVDSAAGDEVYPGYKLVGGQYQFYIMVDEAYANEHEVWVFSLNEVEPNILINPCDLDPEGCGGGGGGGGGGGNPDDDPTDAPARHEPFPELGHQKINFKIQYMRFSRYANNESWLSGASEIAIKAKLVCHNGRELGVIGGPQKEYSSDQYSNKLGKLIIKVKRKQFKHEDLLTVNFPMQTNWQNQDPNQDPIYFIYTIFERDKFPATEHRENRYAPISLITNEPPPGPFKLYWRSADRVGQGGPYAKYFFTSVALVAPTANEYCASGLVENSMVAFNTVQY